MRHLTHALILTTIPHVFSIYWAVDVHPTYVGIIVASTCASVCWHMAHEPQRSIVFYIDYGLAGVWTITDIALAYFTHNINTIIGVTILNAIALITNHIRIPSMTYETTHSIWHCISCLKASLVAYLLANSFNKTHSDFHAYKVT